jgi:histidyl-tRNA synthetase
LGTRYVVVLGEDELRQGNVTLRDMVSGEQRRLTADEAKDEIAGAADAASVAE